MRTLLILLLFPIMVHSQNLVINGTFDKNYDGWQTGILVDTIYVEDGVLNVETWFGLGCRQINVGQALELTNDVYNKTFDFKFDMSCTIPMQIVIQDAYNSGYVLAVLEPNGFKSYSLPFTCLSSMRAGWRIC